MRSFSLLGIIIALVVAGLLVKRQLSVMKSAAPPPAIPSPDATRQAPVTEQVKDTLDQIMRERQTALEQAEGAAR
ncbi:MAG: hypothetical protein M0Q87_10385 [Ottowia sp.]|nr:hypothetical protein [Ottowia sp.]